MTIIRTKKSRGPARTGAVLCSVICAMALILFSGGEKPAAVSSPGRTAEESFWEDYALFVSGLFGDF